MRFIKPYPALLSLALLLTSCGGGSGGGGNPSLLNAEVVLNGASFPTALRFLPNGDILYTEKNSGMVRMIDDGVLLPTPVVDLAVNASGERGLLGLAIDPDYATNGFIYLYYTKISGTENEVIRYTVASNVGGSPTPIVPGLPASANHNAGRLEFGPDGKLYVTLGDVLNPANSQNDASPAGKVLRYNSDGSIPGDNPVASNPMFAKGLRNSFGLAIDPASGTVFVADNGPGCDDRVIRVTSNGNYNWRPDYPCGDPGFADLIRRYTSVIAPTGLAVGTGAYDDTLLMGSFNDKRLRQISLTSFPGGSFANETTLFNATDAIIDVTMGPDGNPYVCTSGGQILRLVP